MSLQSGLSPAPLPLLRVPQEPNGVACFSNIKAPIYNPEAIAKIYRIDSNGERVFVSQTTGFKCYNEEIENPFSREKRYPGYERCNFN